MRFMTVACGARLRIPAFAGLVLASLALGGDEPRGEAPPLPRPPKVDFAGKRSLRVMAITSGHTLMVERDGEPTALRLVGVYVPRRRHVGDAAQPYLARLLAGERVWVLPEPAWPERDAEQRVWAHVYRDPDGLYVNLELIRLGYARFAAGRRIERQRLLRAYEAHARRCGKGIWQVGPSSSAQKQPPVRRRRVAASQPTPRAGAQAEVVYVTPHGTKYHRAECRFVRDGGVKLSLAEAKAKGYTPCALCKPPG
jgi:endonuclease YncB( thermonuclease family)